MEETNGAVEHGCGQLRGESKVVPPCRASLRCHEQEAFGARRARRSRSLLDTSCSSLPRGVLQHRGRDLETRFLGPPSRPAFSLTRSVLVLVLGEKGAWQGNSGIDLVYPWPHLSRLAVQSVALHLAEQKVSAILVLRHVSLHVRWDVSEIHSLLCNHVRSSYDG